MTTNTEDMTPVECLDWIVKIYIAGMLDGSPAANRVAKIRAALLARQTGGAA